MTTAFDRLRVRSAHRTHLSDAEASDLACWPHGEGKAVAALADLRHELDRLQELFYADGRRGMLVVLQGMDTSGKDGVIRHVFEGVNPQGVRVASFKPPTPDEQAHDFLWRVHARTPAKGEIVIFNRSHYEDVLVARVHHLVPKKVWRTRFDTINAFERELVDEGFCVLKFFLHVSRKEQRRRLQARLDDPAKHWKLSAADFAERRYWSKYVTAYDEMLRRTSTAWAPWYVLPSDVKWFRNLAVSTVLVDALQSMHLRFPPSSVDARAISLR